MRNIERIVPAICFTAVLLALMYLDAFINGHMSISSQLMALL